MKALEALQSFAEHPAEGVVTDSTRRSLRHRRNGRVVGAGDPRADLERQLDALTERLAEGKI
jgi:hypothetical protein